MCRLNRRQASAAVRGSGRARFGFVRAGAAAARGPPGGVVSVPR
jgi:hypothetical protein